MKTKYPATEAREVANQLCDALEATAHRVTWAGSLRRESPEVGDVEILFIPKIVHYRTGVLEETAVSLASETINGMVKAGVLAKRPLAKGRTAWGEKNKLAVHVASGIPVDLFAATLENWFNYLVCRTGPAESNIRIASAAKARGWTWNPYGAGFSRVAGLATEVHRVKSEQEVFEFVGLPYLPPPRRR